MPVSKNPRQPTHWRNARSRADKEMSHRQREHLAIRKLWISYWSHPSGEKRGSSLAELIDIRPCVLGIRHTLCQARIAWCPRQHSGLPDCPSSDRVVGSSICVDNILAYVHRIPKQSLARAMRSRPVINERQESDNHLEVWNPNYSGEVVYPVRQT